MQTTSALYQSIVADLNHYFETKLEINGVSYPEKEIFEMTTSIQMFGSDPEIGKVVAQEINVRMLDPGVTIPPMAEIRPFVRACNATQQSEWLPQGVFYVDTRETSISYDDLHILTLHGFDAILKTEQDYAETALTWPAADIDIFGEIAGKIGVTVDPRMSDLMTEGYTYPLPTGYSLREMLGFIAAEYVGCVILSEENKLRLVSLPELPKETNLLIDQNGNYITFGGVRILVGT